MIPDLPNRRARTPFAVIAVLLIVGCAVDATQPRELGSHLVSTLNSYGARRCTVRPIPQLRCQWTYLPDKDGFQFHVRGDLFPEVDRWFRTTYGVPPKCYQKEGLRHPMYVYDVATLGIAVQYGYDANRDSTFIVGVKPRDVLKDFGLTPSRAV